MFKRILLAFLLIFTFARALPLLAQESERPIIAVPAPLMFEDTYRRMKTAGFWISKLNTPDKLILNQAEIKALNARIRGSFVNIQEMTLFPSKMYKRNMVSDTKNTIQNYLASGKYFTDINIPVTKDFFTDIENKIDYAALSSTATARFAMPVRFALMRMLPTNKKLYSDYFSTDIDKIQASEFDIGSPFAVLYTTKDKKWHYVESETSQGWVTNGVLAFCTRADIKSFTQSEKFIIVKSAKADIYKDAALTDHYDYARMGTRFPATGKKINSSVEILRPAKNINGKLLLVKAYIHNEDISHGYLRYTQRNAIKQAFKLLHSPYGWGGMGGEQDCSSFIKQVFSCFGIVLPRNSTNQSKIGVLAGSFTSKDTNEFKMKAITKNAVPGISIFYFPGHIMLYLGIDKGVPYVIHSVWGYTEDTPELSTTRVINRTMVTSLNIGTKSDKGSFFNRLMQIRVIK
jgi:hypothetical protein